MNDGFAAAWAAARRDAARDEAQRAARLARAFLDPETCRLTRVGKAYHDALAGVRQHPLDGDWRELLAAAQRSFDRATAEAHAAIAAAEAVRAPAAEHLDEAGALAAVPVAPAVAPAVAARVASPCNAAVAAVEEAGTPAAAAAAHLDEAAALAAAPVCNDATTITTLSVRGQSLRAFDCATALSLHGPSATRGHRRLTSLDLSRNEILTLPGLAAAAPLLQHLDLSRNWFNTMPADVALLPELRTLNVRRNFFKPTTESLGLAGLAALPHLELFDISFNAKCKRQSHADLVARALSRRVKVLITVSFPAPPGAYVGARPSDRDATLLRAQIEPHGTLVLRRRLEADFGRPPTDPEDVLRAEVMTRLLACYAEEGMCDPATGKATRQVVKLQGEPVAPALLQEMLDALREWAHHRKEKNRQERPSIRAQNYMILRSPTEFGPKLGSTSKRGSRKAALAAEKFARHEKLWDLATRAVRAVDPEFAERFTALAVTHGFVGSPHIDKQNIGPFYGLSMGDFPEGQGGIRVECNARVVAEMNTRNRLGKVDGRYPHWVAPYDEGAERYSLIFYQTEGEPMKYCVLPVLG
jgi:hypothetical protein